MRWESWLFIWHRLGESLEFVQRPLKRRQNQSNCWARACGGSHSQLYPFQRIRVGYGSNCDPMAIWPYVFLYGRSILPGIFVIVVLPTIISASIVFAFLRRRLSGLGAVCQLWWSLAWSSRYRMFCFPYSTSSSLVRR